MSTFLHDDYDIEHSQTSRLYKSGPDAFAPSLQSLRSAQEIVRRYESRRRAGLGPIRLSREASADAAATAAPSASDNIVSFRGPVWARPSISLVYSRLGSSARALSPAPHARRAALQSEARRLARQMRPPSASALSPLALGGLDPIPLDHAQGEVMQQFSVLVIQGLAVAFGLSGLLLLLTLL